MDIVFKESNTVCNITPNPGKATFIFIDLSSCTTTEWTIHQPIAQIGALIQDEIDEELKKKKVSYPTMNILIKIKRNWSTYFW